MARKDLLKNVMGLSVADEVELESRNTPPSPAEIDNVEGNNRPSRFSSGAIGAVSEAFSQIKAKSEIELDTTLIADSEIPDRLALSTSDIPEEQWVEFVESIRSNGQRIPILVRPNPDHDKRQVTPYQIVFGRRRLKALRELGRPVLAKVRDMDDREAILAQGQENSARADLTFIEKALFAYRLERAGHQRETIMSALTADKTIVSRWIGIAEKIPAGILEYIGPAPKAGRSRWVEFSEAIDRPGALKSLKEVMDAPDQPNSSDERFERAIRAIKRRRVSSLPGVVKDVRGRTLGKTSRTDKETRLILRRDMAAGFDDWLIERLQELHSEWLTNHSPEAERDTQVDS